MIVDIQKLFNTNPNIPITKVSTSITRKIFYNEKIELCHEFSKASLNKSEFYGCVFSKQTFEDITVKNCKFFECSFFGCTFKSAEFQSCNFKNCLFVKPKFEKSYLDPTSIDFDHSDWENKAANINTTLFQRIESNSKDTHQNSFAEKAHIAFRRYRRAQYKYEFFHTALLSKRVRLAKQILLDYLYDYILVYGYGLFRASIITVALFFFVLCWLDNNWKSATIAASSPPSAHTLSQKSYFLLTTITTTGFVDKFPDSEPGTLFVIAVAIFSIIWTAMLTGLVVNRLVK